MRRTHVLWCNLVRARAWMGEAEHLSLGRQAVRHVQCLRVGVVIFDFGQSWSRYSGMRAEQVCVYRGIFAWKMLQVSLWSRIPGFWLPLVVFLW